MEESAVDLMWSSDPPITPMTPEAWALLVLMLALVTWGWLSIKKDIE